MSLEIEYRFSVVEKFVNQATAKGLEEEYASRLCQLGSIMVCGNLERCVELAISRRLESHSPKQVASFLKSFFRRGTNYDCEAICQLVHKFDNAWGNKLEAALTESMKTSIASCYSVRNSIAHGGTHSLGPKSLRQYFDASFEVVVALETSLA